MPFSGWSEVDAACERVIEASSESYPLATIQNLNDVIAVCRIHAPLPEQAAKGYWTTFSLSWTAFELEIFDDRVEVYLFEPQPTEIWYELHTPGQRFSEQFIDELRRLAKRVPDIPS